MHKAKPTISVVRKFLSLGLALTWMAGCYPPSALELDYGNSVRNNIAQQVVNPQAALNPVPAVGLSPQAAAEEMKSYDKSFAPEEQKTKSQPLKTNY
jgi:hypothetical protein